MGVINRDASDKYKGFRYQKMRIAKKVLELIKEHPKTNIIAIPEHRDDGYFIGENGLQEFEQDKQYSRSFSFNSIEVRKSLVNFLDNYFELNKDPYLHFIFYTNVDIAKERKSGFLDELNLKPLNKPVIDYLNMKDYKDEVIEYVSRVLLETYIKEYNINLEDNESIKAGFYEKISVMNPSEWVSFLNQVSFQFGQVDIEELKQEIDKEIRESDFYLVDHVNKEEQIRNGLLEKIDERMAETHITQKIINTDTVKIVFHEVSNNVSDFQIDEMYVHWEELIEEYNIDSDYRNLREKIEEVCFNFNPKILRRLSRDSTTVRDEIKRFNVRQINSLKYRVYESMGRYFDNQFDYKDSYTHEELNSTVKDLRQSVVNDIENLRKDFNYGIQNNITVGKIVLLLIDECFYSFEEE